MRVCACVCVACQKLEDLLEEEEEKDEEEKEDKKNEEIRPK